VIDPIPFLSSGVSPQGMFSSEFRRNRSLFIGVMDGPFGFEGIQEGAEEHGVVELGTYPLNYYINTLL
jgi:hypothetical protein